MTTCSHSHPSAGTAAGTDPVHATGSCASLEAFDILAHCHEHILGRLDELAGIAGGLLAGQPLDEPRLARLAGILAFLDTAIPVHTLDEEQTLFPRLRKVEPFRGAHGTPMDCMENDHVGHRKLMAALKRELMRADAMAVGRAARAIVAEYRDHIAKENEVLFPWARELLADKVVIAEMTREMRQHRVDAGLLGAC